jgi:hypothetical protein
MDRFATINVLIHVNQLTASGYVMALTDIAHSDAQTDFMATNVTTPAAVNV